GVGSTTRAVCDESAIASLVGWGTDASARPGVACEASFISGIVMRSPGFTLALTARSLARAITATGLRYLRAILLSVSPAATTWTTDGATSLPRGAEAVRWLTVLDW